MDTSEAKIESAAGFLESVYGESLQDRPYSRAPTPMTVCYESSSFPRSLQSTGLKGQWSVLSLDKVSIAGDGETELLSGEVATQKALCTSNLPSHESQDIPSKLPFWNTSGITRKQAKLRFGNSLQDPTFVPNASKRNIPQRPSTLPQFPDISDFSVPVNSNSEYAILVSMYEVYNDRIFDLLSHPRNLKEVRRRPLLFKPTEGSPDRKLVAGLRKILCGTYEEALMVLETGLMERRVAGTGSNSVSSRSHGFFCVDVKRRTNGGMSASWNGAQLTIVDLAGMLMN